MWLEQLLVEDAVPGAPRSHDLGGTALVFLRCASYWVCTENVSWDVLTRQTRDAYLHDRHRHLTTTTRTIKAIMATTATTITITTVETE